MEGLLCGAPVIVGGDCGCGELIAEAKAGLLTTHGDVAELRRHILALLTERALAEAMVARGRAYVAQHLDPVRVAQAYAEVYRQAGVG
jgi:glycosyltransferase involved in cell wall biosynthesis